MTMTLLIVNHSLLRRLAEAAIFLPVLPKAAKDGNLWAEVVGDRSSESRMIASRICRGISDWFLTSLSLYILSRVEALVGLRVFIPLVVSTPRRHADSPRRLRSK